MDVDYISKKAIADVIVPLSCDPSDVNRSESEENPDETIVEIRDEDISGSYSYEVVKFCGSVKIKSDADDGDDIDIKSEPIEEGIASDVMSESERNHGESTEKVEEEVGDSANAYSSENLKLDRNVGIKSGEVDDSDIEMKSEPIEEATPSKISKGSDVQLSDNGDSQTKVEASKKEREKLQKHVRIAGELFSESVTVSGNEDAKSDHDVVMKSKEVDDDDIEIKFEPIEEAKSSSISKGSDVQPSDNGDSRTKVEASKKKSEKLQENVRIAGEKFSESITVNDNEDTKSDRNVGINSEEVDDSDIEIKSEPIEEATSSIIGEDSDVQLSDNGDSQTKVESSKKRIEKLQKHVTVAGELFSESVTVNENEDTKSGLANVMTNIHGTVENADGVLPKERENLKRIRGEFGDLDLVEVKEELKMEIVDEEIEEERPRKKRKVVGFFLIFIYYFGYIYFFFFFFFYNKCCFTFQNLALICH